MGVMVFMGYIVSSKGGKPAAQGYSASASHRSQLL